MKTIYRIAKTELNTLFYSPIAWLILIIFTFQASMCFSELFANQVRYQALGYSLYGVTFSLLGGMQGVFPTMLGNLYLYIPLLTMGLMSRELSSGSIKLLYSSPVTNTQIIFGKYLAMMVYGLILSAILIIYVSFSLCTVKSMDLPAALSGVLGLYLLTCAYAAIGLFMSTLTSYQVVAAMGTLALLAVLNFIGSVGQSIELVRDITYWLSISGRASEFVDGLICSEDIIYFLVVIVLFVVLSIMKLQGERTKRALGVRIARYCGVVAIALCVGYASSRPALMCYYDATSTKSKTLTLVSQDVMKKLDGGLTITTYVNLLEDNSWKGMPSHVNYDAEQFKQYIRFKPEIEMKYVYYYDKAENDFLDRQYPALNDEQRAKELIKVHNYDSTMFLSPAEIKKIINLEPEGNRFVRVIERENGQKTFLRIYSDNMRDPSEQEITAALKRMVVKPPKVGFLSGHGERDIQREGDRDYSLFARSKTFRHSLLNQGFDAVSVSVSEGQEIPEDLDILVISELKNTLPETERRKIDAYIARGGNLFIAGEPGRQEFMNPLIEQLGVQFMPGRLVQLSKDFAPDLIIGDVTKEAAEMSEDYAYLLKRDYKMTFPGSAGLAYTEDKGFKIMPVIATNDSACWNEVETTDFADDVPVLNAAVGEEIQTIPLVLSLSRNVGDKEQRIIISGDADCISNGELSMSRNDIRSANYSLITESFGALCYGEFPINNNRPLPPDNAVYLGMESSIWIKIGFMGLLPLLLVGWSLMIWIKRRGR